MLLFHSQEQNSLTARLFLSELENTWKHHKRTLLHLVHVTAASRAEISSHLTKEALKETEIFFTNCIFASENWKWAFTTRGHRAPLLHTYKAKLWADICFLLPSSELLHSIRRSNHDQGMQREMIQLQILCEICIFKGIPVNITKFRWCQSLLSQKKCQELKKCKDSWVLDQQSHLERQIFEQKSMQRTLV